ncbi:MAG: hypothetical protein IJT54_09810 [Candidatus Methanomethylophilaceae archaeon]|nr:hypothetical protein [Candidatus Methanomethylophilaceae archaeon]
MRFCERCGCELTDGTTHCPECGRPLFTEPIINTDKRNGKGWIALMLSMLCAAVLTFFLTYYYHFYFMAFFLPIFFFSRGRSDRTVVDYILMGAFVGLLIGYIIGMFALYVRF